VGAKACSPLKLDVHIDNEPPLASTFPTTLEGSLDIFLPMVVTKRQSNPIPEKINFSYRARE
jgi:hypothetical protein